MEVTHDASDGGSEEPSTPENQPDVSSPEEPSQERPAVTDGLQTVPQWTSAVGTTGPTIDDKKQTTVAQDSQGNIYMVGSFQSPFSMGTCKATTRGAHDIFVAKFDPKGTCLWVQQAGGSTHDQGTGIAVDSKDNVLITGTFSGLAEFGATTLAFKGASDLFLAKLDGKGNWLYVKQVGDLGETYDGGLAVDSKDNAYLTGTFGANATIGSLSLTYKGSYRNTWIAKADTNGIWQWARSIDGYSIHGFQVGVDGNDNVFVAGHTSDEIKFDGLTSAKPYGNGNTFVLSLDSSGKGRWVAVERGRTAGGRSSPKGLAFDSQNNLYITGYYQGQASFGTYDMASFNTSNSSEGYVAKLNTQGKWEWARELGTPFHETLYAVTVDDNDNVFVTGFFSGIVSLAGANLKSAGKEDVFVGSLTNKGQWRWVVQGGSTENDRGSGIYIDKQGDVVVVGRFGGKGTFGSVAHQSTIHRNMFIAKLR